MAYIDHPGKNQGADIPLIAPPTILFWRRSWCSLIMNSYGILIKFGNFWHCFSAYSKPSPKLGLGLGNIRGVHLLSSIQRSGSRKMPRWGSVMDLESSCLLNVVIFNPKTYDTRLLFLQFCPVEPHFTCRWWDFVLWTCTSMENVRGRRCKEYSEISAHMKRCRNPFLIFLEKRI